MPRLLSLCITLFNSAEPETKGRNPRRPRRRAAHQNRVRGRHRGTVTRGHKRGKGAHAKSADPLASAARAARAHRALRVLHTSNLLRAAAAGWAAATAPTGRAAAARPPSHLGLGPFRVY